jgi:hypothetical protein
MSEPKRPERVLPDTPVYRPLERFWPYAELPEQPTDEELAKIHPELHTALFGAPPHPFSISVEFPAFDGDAYARAVDLAKKSDEYAELQVDGAVRHRARFVAGEHPSALRDLYELVSGFDETAVLIDDRPVPFARELWLPLVWFLIR